MLCHYHGWMYWDLYETALCSRPGRRHHLHVSYCHLVPFSLWFLRPIQKPNASVFIVTGCLGRCLFFIAFSSSLMFIYLVICKAFWSLLWSVVHWRPSLPLALSVIHLNCLVRCLAFSKAWSALKRVSKSLLPTLEVTVILLLRNCTALKDFNSSVQPGTYRHCLCVQLHSAFRQWFAVRFMRRIGLSYCDARHI